MICPPDTSGVSNSVYVTERASVATRQVACPALLQPANRSLARATALPLNESGWRRTTASKERSSILISARAVYPLAFVILLTGISDMDRLPPR